MKKSFLFIGLIGLIMSFASCERLPAILPEKIDTQKEIIDLIYSSIGNTTHDQITETIYGMGYYEGFYRDWSFYHSFLNYDTESNYDYSDDAKIIITVGWEESGDPNDISMYGFLSRINRADNPAVLYKQVSDVFAEYGYTDWNGYCENSADASKVSLTDRDEFLSLIGGYPWKSTDSRQHSIETFVYTHSDNTKWKGELHLKTEIHDYRENEYDDPKIVKNIDIDFYLRRIQ